MLELQHPVESLSFETALKELETIVKSLEEGNIELDNAVNVYERGMALKNRCEFLIDNAKMRVEKIKVNSDQTITTEDF